MLKFNIQSPDEAMENYKKQLLLQDAMKAQSYYRSGDFKPSTINQVIRRNTDQMYNYIDMIGARIGSNLTLDETGKGKKYRDETAIIIEEFIRDLVIQLKNSLITPEVYNSILGYASQVIGSTSKGIDIEIRDRNLKIDGTDPQKQISELMAKNFTQMSSNAINQMAQDLGDTNKDIKEILKEIQKATAQRLVQGTETQTQTDVSAPSLVPVTSGEVTTVGVAPVAAERLHIDPNEGNEAEIAMREAFIGREKFKELDSVSEGDEYGLGHQWPVVNSMLSDMIDIKLRERKTPMEFLRELDEEIKYIKRKVPTFESSRMRAKVSQIYKRAYDERVNDILSAQEESRTDRSRESNRNTRALAIMDELNSRDDYRKLKPTVVEAQREAARPLRPLIRIEDEGGASPAQAGGIPELTYPINRPYGPREQQQTGTAQSMRPRTRPYPKKETHQLFFPGAYESLTKKTEESKRMEKEKKERIKFEEAIKRSQAKYGEGKKKQSKPKPKPQPKQTRKSVKALGEPTPPNSSVQGPMIMTVGGERRAATNKKHDLIFR